MVSDQSAAIDFNTAATQTLAAAVAGKRIVVLQYALVNGVATGQSVQFKSGTNNLTGVMQLPQSIGGQLAVNGGSEQTAVFMTDAGAALSMVMSAATQVGGHIAFRYV